jgi:transcription initiation factor TFIIIB Brf1 subunit/transcription initiation factor TFIIB
MEDGSEEDYDGVYEDTAYIQRSNVYTTHHAIPRSGERTIRPDLVKLGLPVNIINEASNIYQQMTVGTKRGNCRKMLLFFCAFSAHNKLKIPVDPTRLANMCGLDRSSISKSLSMYSSVHTEYETPLVHHHPTEYIPKYYEKLASIPITFPSGALEHIKSITDEVLERDSELLEEKPQTVAAAILVFYLQINGCTLDKSKYRSIFGRSDMTINKIKKKVSKAYNE